MTVTSEIAAGLETTLLEVLTQILNTVFTARISKISVKRRY